MQAAKIKINEIYATRDENNALVMFRVDAVITRRAGEHSSNYSHKVEGRILNPDRSVRGDMITLTPSKLLGLYAEHAELVAAKAAADAETARIKQEKLERKHAQMRQLYRLAGLPVPEDIGKNRNNPITSGYGDDINIDCDVVERILAGLNRPVLKVVS